MEYNILTYCDAKEVNSIGSNTLYEFGKGDWSADEFLTNILGNIKRENDILSDSIGDVKKNPYTEELTEMDSIFDQDFIALKSFLNANLQVRDRNITENAEQVLRIIEAHNSNLHRLGYEKQIASSKSLLTDFEKPHVQAMIAGLVGVPDRVAQLKNSATNLEALYQKSKEEAANQENTIPPSTQMLPVRELFNKELLPYLQVMVKVKPEIYEQIFKVIVEYLESINRKARARKTRHAKQAGNGKAEAVGKAEEKDKKEKNTKHEELA